MGFFVCFFFIRPQMQCVIAAVKSAADSALTRGLSDNMRSSPPAKLLSRCKVTSAQDTPLEGVPGEVETRSRSPLSCRKVRSPFTRSQPTAAVRPSLQQQ